MTTQFGHSHDLPVWHDKADPVRPNCCLGHEDAFGRCVCRCHPPVFACDWGRGYRPRLCTRAAEPGRDQCADHIREDREDREETKS